MNNISLGMSSKILGHPYEIKMNFLNGGEITIPSKFGGYVIASGCGSGKTTIIKELIKTCNKEGILYSAATINECNEMYKYCLSLSKETGYLSEEDIVVLHSDYMSEGVNNSLLYNNSSKIKDKKIIICTHHKLLNESPEILLGYNGNVINKSDLSPQRRSSISFDSNGFKSYPRQLILIDELPTCNQLRVKINKQILRLLGVQKIETKLDEKGESYIQSIIPPEYISNKSFEVTKKLYELNSTNPGFKFFNSNTESTKLKEDILLGLIHDNYNDLINRSEEEFYITYNITDLIFDNMETRFLLFDGTGDLTFKFSERFKVLSYEKKYSSEININTIPFSLKRSYKEKDYINNINYITSNLDENIRFIKDLISNGNKTLIVTWKNFKIKEFDVSIPNIYMTSEEVNDNFSIPEYIKLRLSSMGVIGGYDVIHYQSGLDKATNMYRDFDSIIFLGEFHVPNSVIYNFNIDFKVNTDLYNYTIYQLTQAICRTRIRNHKGESINIFFSSDWNNNIISGIGKYLTNNYESNMIELTETYIRPKWREAIDKLSQFDSRLETSIKDNENISLTLTLDQIYSLIPMYEKKVKSYNSLVGYLKSLGIELKIESEKRNQYSK